MGQALGRSGPCPHSTIIWWEIETEGQVYWSGVASFFWKRLDSKYSQLWGSQWPCCNYWTPPWWHESSHRIHINRKHGVCQQNCNHRHENLNFIYVRVSSNIILLLFWINSLKNVKTILSSYRHMGIVNPDLYFYTGKDTVVWLDPISRKKMLAKESQGPPDYYVNPKGMATGWRRGRPAGLSAGLRDGFLPSSMQRSWLISLLPGGLGTLLQTWSSANFALYGHCVTLIKSQANLFWKSEEMLAHRLKPGNPSYNQEAIFMGISWNYPKQWSRTGITRSPGAVPRFLVLPWLLDVSPQPAQL